MLESKNLVSKIKKKMPLFDEEELLQYTKLAIPTIHNTLKAGDGKKLKIKCKEELINKLLEDRVKYKMTNNIDHTGVQYVKLFDYVENDKEMLIKVYSSIYFYDSTENNIYEDELEEKYWNDIWIITYRENIKSKLQQNKGNCENCGALMKYDGINDIFECEYCGNIIYKQLDANWEIVDIEVK